MSVYSKVSMLRLVIYKKPTRRNDLKEIVPNYVHDMRDSLPSSVCAEHITVFNCIIFSKSFSFQIEEMFQGYRGDTLVTCSSNHLCEYHHTVKSHPVKQAVILFVPLRPCSLSVGIREKKTQYSTLRRDILVFIYQTFI